MRVAVVDDENPPQGDPKDYLNKRVLIPGKPAKTAFTFAIEIYALNVPLSRNGCKFTSFARSPNRCLDSGIRRQ
jgi:hypothetical protein